MNILLAALVFSLTPNVQYGSRGNAVVFTGTLSNTNASDVFLNDIQITITNLLTGQTNAFFANVPGILSAGETYSDVVFAVSINSNTPPDDYSGTATIQGGTNIFTADTLASQSFQVTVAATPFGVWQWQQFGTTNSADSADLADPDGDGSVNLLEYALHSDPGVASTAGLPVGEGDTGCDCLTLTYTKVLAATDLSYTVEGADDPGGSWSSAGITESIVDADTLTLTIRASDTGNPFSTTGKRFLHLRINRSP